MFACEQALPPSPSGRGAGGEGAGESGKGGLRFPDIPSEAIEFARKLRHEQTDAESMMWYLLRDRRLGGHKFRRQHPMPPYTLDFYCPEAGLVIELDGGQHAESARDARRDAWLVQQGLRVVRFWNNQVLQETEAVLSEVWAALHAGARPHPQPLSPGERGEEPKQAGIRPDFICLSKGITGGYLPLSAVLTTDDVYAAFYGDATARGFLHSHSYTGNPLACRAALAVLNIFEHDQVIAANRAKSIEFTGVMAEVAAHPRVRHFRHLGMIWAFDVADATPGFSTRFHRAALALGMFIRPVGNTVYIMPPYVTNADDMRGLAGAMLRCLDNPAI
ncbi:MAG: aminotransferase class III-fold pyridoxal phosphate-dependent enzyme [Thiobacillus sp.]